MPKPKTPSERRYAELSRLAKATRLAKFAAFSRATTLETALDEFTAIDYAGLVAMRGLVHEFDEALRLCQVAVGEYNQARDLAHDGTPRGEG